MKHDIRSLARALGGDVAAGEVLCPGPGHSPRDRSLSVKLSPSSPDGVIVHSFAADDWRDCRDHVRERLGLRHERPAADRPRPSRIEDPDDVIRRERTRAYVADLIAEMRPVRGTPGESYLRETRRINTRTIADVVDRVGAIGWHDAVRFNEAGHPLHRQRLGCIIAVMTDPVTAKPTGGISRTYLSPDGRKVTKAKGLGPAGVVRISLDEDVLGGLFIAEGLETALAGMSIGLRPIWATGSTSVMAKLPVIAGIECISVIADHDANGTGEKAARELEQRWRSAGREARVWIPQSPGDLNDILMGRAS